MVACLVLGFTAFRRRGIAVHRAWMIRAYAIGRAAGTQAFTEGGAVFGAGELHGDLAKGAGWVIQLRRGGMGHPPQATRAPEARCPFADQTVITTFPRTWPFSSNRMASGASSSG
jgi:hypothetical protein